MNTYCNIIKEKLMEYVKTHTSFYANDIIQTYQQNQSAKHHINNPLTNTNEQKLLFNIIDELNKTRQKFTVFAKDPKAVIIGYNTCLFLLPADCIQIPKQPDYNNIKPSDLLQQHNQKLTLPVKMENISKNDLLKEKENLQNQMESLKTEEEKILKGETAELKNLQDQITALQNQLKNQQNILLKELATKQETIKQELLQMQKRIFILESQIYGIRCYLGETVSFYTIRTGKPAPVNQPLVIHQKIRFLNEELGRYLSIYDYGNNENDKETLLSVLKNRPDITDFLIPGNKSIAVIKISRDGTIKGRINTLTNLLTNYKILHDNQLAILIRNGEQLHIGWLDADKINYQDDVFLRPQQKTQSASEPAETTEANKTNIHELLSRWFFFSILQGLLQRSKLIAIPNTDSLQNNPYIIFNHADHWISVNLYGSFEEMINKSCHIPLQKGDDILTGMQLHRTRNPHGYQIWNNDRGIGDRNRTEGLSLPGQTILSVNKVLPSLKIQYTGNIFPMILSENPKGRIWYKDELGGFSTIKMKNTDIFDHYESTWTLTPADTPIRTEIWEETISPDTWYSYQKSWKNLSENRLIYFSKSPKTSPFYYKKGNKGESIPVYYIKPEEIAKRKVDVFICQITNAEIKELTKHQYYCSIPQTGYNKFGTTSYHVNFQFYTNEIIPLNFLCHDWIKEIIRSGHIGNYTLCGSHMSFADMLPYLNIMLKYLQDRKKQEEQMLKAENGTEWLKNHSDWEDQLVTWRIKHQYHNLTPARAKKFLKEKDCKNVKMEKN